MQLQHLLFLAALMLGAYYVGTHYPMGIKYLG